MIVEATVLIMLIQMSVVYGAQSVIDAINGLNKPKITSTDIEVLKATMKKPEDYFDK